MPTDPRAASAPRPQRARNGRSASTSTCSRPGGPSGPCRPPAPDVRAVPARHDRLERVALARERDDGRVVGGLERVEAAEDVGGLAKRQAEIGPVERDVAEPDRARGRPTAASRSQPSSAEIHGSGTRDCTRRCISTERHAACRRPRPARAASALICFSSTTSRGSARGGRGDAQSRSDMCHAARGFKWLGRLGAVEGLGPWLSGSNCVDRRLRSLESCA